MTWIYTRRTSFVLNLSRLFTVQLSMFSVVFSNSDMLSHLQVFVNNFFIFLFQFFRTDVLSFCDSFDILSNLFRFVKNFFHFLFRSDSVLCDSLIILSNRQPFVNNFFKKIRTTSIANSSGERGIWTLAPVDPTYTLSRGTSSATWVFLQSSLFDNMMLFDAFVTHIW